MSQSFQLWWLFCSKTVGIRKNFIWVHYTNLEVFHFHLHYKIPLVPSLPSFLKGPFQLQGIAHYQYIWWNCGPGIVIPAAWEKEQKPITLGKERPVVKWEVNKWEGWMEGGMQMNMGGEQAREKEKREMKWRSKGIYSRGGREISPAYDNRVYRCGRS